MEKLVLIALLIFCLGRIFIALITKEVDFNKESKHGTTKKKAIRIIIVWAIFMFLPIPLTTIMMLTPFVLFIMIIFF